MAVWTYGYMAPLDIRRMVDRAVVRTGAGYVYTAFKGPDAVQRANGAGTITSYRGANVFRLRVDFREWASAQAIINFLQDRLDEGITAFQIYNVHERPEGTDNTGVATTGMYWVKHLQPLHWVADQARLTNFLDLEFEEDLTKYS